MLALPLVLPQKQRSLGDLTPAAIEGTGLDPDRVEPIESLQLVRPASGASNSFSGMTLAAHPGS